MLDIGLRCYLDERFIFILTFQNLMRIFTVHLVVNSAEESSPFLSSPLLGHWSFQALLYMLKMPSYLSYAFTNGTLLSVFPFGFFQYYLQKLVNVLLASVINDEHSSSKASSLASGEFRGVGYANSMSMLSAVSVMSSKS